MVVYIEIAILENFLIDGALLTCALWITKRKISVFRLCVAAGIGAGFAVVFPLYVYPQSVEYFLKISVGFLLPYIAILEKGVGRYLTTACLFMSLSFCFAGMVIAVSDFFSMENARLPIGGVFAIGIFFLLGVYLLGKRLYAKKTLLQFVYPCRIRLGEKEIFTSGFLDSGNRLQVNGKPVCFITPDLVYELIGASYIQEETTVLTVAGEKKIKIFQADVLEIYYDKTAHRIEKIYLSPSTHILGREYKILLGGWAIEGKEAN